MSTMRVVIVDDEPLARARLRMLLAPHADVELAGEAASADEAGPLIREKDPDVLLLDIQMPRGSGLDLLERLGDAAPPVVIFTTAHAQFGAKAFDVGATDYLVKPFDGERVDRALDRARRTLTGAAPRIEPPAGRWRERFAVRSRDQILVVKAADVVWIGAEGNYSRLHTVSGGFLIREALKSLEETLDPQQFLRVHRSAIVNIDRMEKLVASDDGGYSIVLTGGATVPLGPSFRSRLETIMGGKV